MIIQRDLFVFLKVFCQIQDCVVHIFVLIEEYLRFFIPLQKKLRMDLHFTGILIAVCTFVIIGVFHPLVIKTEYHTGTRFWWVFLLLGILSICSALCIANVLLSSILGVLGASLLWSIGELFSQKKRVEKGWFPMNPKRKDEYNMVDSYEEK